MSNNLKFVLVTGLMGSGKSNLLREYMLNFKTQVVEFTRPPVEAKFQGQDFEFLDNIFGIRNRKNQYIYNFYELDAPTIKRWTQFIQIADSIIIVANINQLKQYSTPEALLDVILEHAPDTPLQFVAVNFDTFQTAKQDIEEKYKTGRITAKHEIVGITDEEKIFDEVYGERFMLSAEKLKEIFDWHLDLEDN
ncbi:MAG: hypothetical protein INQ03_25525 [Candidatus Heimdallarchaeota archaeon]|nr:hypothetical protein [Candidatus Heimdallarchaeota archaeon]